MSKEWVLNRCRPVPEGEWDINKTYLELSVVFNPENGNSYTSRIPVPAGTALTNTEYWVLTSNYAAQDTMIIRRYLTVADMRADTSLTESSVAITTGYHKANDGGGAVYLLTSGIYVDTPLHQQIDFTDLYALLVYGESVNVKQFGAVGDGVTNDTLAFKDIFSMVTNAQICIPVGNYVVDSTVTFSDGVYVDCQGTIIDKTTTGFLFEGNNLTFAHIYGLKINGTGALNHIVNGTCTIGFKHSSNISLNHCLVTNTPAAYAMQLYYCNDSTICSCTVKNYSYTGISIMNTCNNITVCDNSVINCMNDTDPNSYAIALSSYDTVDEIPLSSNVRCHGNFVDNTFAWWNGIDTHGGVNITIANNIVNNCMTGINIVKNVRNVGLTTGSVSVVNNTIKCTVTEIKRDNSQNYGIVFVGNPNTIDNRDINYSCVGNIMYGAGNLTLTNDRGGIKIGDLANIVVADNVIVDSNHYGISIRSTVSEAIIHDNVITNHRRLTVSSGIIITQAVNMVNVYIRNNMVTNYTDAYRFPLGFATPVNPYILADGNTYFNCTNPYVGVENVVITELPYSPTAGGSKVARVGDMVFNSAPAPNKPFGWVCSEAPTAYGESPTWLPLPNIP